MISHRRCAKCDIETGMKPNGAYTPYTLHPFHEVVAGKQRDQLAVFCASCFDALRTAGARDRAARSAQPHLHAVAS